MTPTPRSRRLTHRAAQVGLLSGLTITGAALALPAGHAAARPTVTAQTAAQPVAVDRTSALRASRSRGLAPKHLPMKQVTRTVAVGEMFSGQASWYGGSFNGRRTANGERFDTNDYTAASKTLPFGTRLRVCHDGCVVVRINDRGPYVGARILDLSRAAASAIGFSGVAHVTATPIGERAVSVVDTNALHRQRAHAAKVARSHQLQALALARADAARRQQLSAVPDAGSQPRTPVALAGGALSAVSGGALRLRRRRP
ncbi:MAG: septal ring lytic transglycosylase RlpA family protein [Mycobacteriales bacterium]